MSQNSLLASQFTRANINHTTSKLRSGMVNLYSNDTLLWMSGFNNNNFNKTNSKSSKSDNKPCCQTKGKSNVLLNNMGGSPIKLEADNKPCCSKGKENSYQSENPNQPKTVSSCSTGSCGCGGTCGKVEKKIDNSISSLYSFENKKIIQDINPFDCRPAGLTDFMYPCDLFDCLSDYKNLNSKGEFLIDLPYVGTIAVDLKNCCQNLNYALFLFN